MRATDETGEVESRRKRGREKEEEVIENEVEEGKTRDNVSTPNTARGERRRAHDDRNESYEGAMTRGRTKRKREEEFKQSGKKMRNIEDVDGWFWEEDAHGEG